MFARLAEEHPARNTLHGGWGPVADMRKVSGVAAAECNRIVVAVLSAAAARSAVHWAASGDNSPRTACTQVTAHSPPLGYVPVHSEVTAYEQARIGIENRVA